MRIGLAPVGLWTYLAVRGGIAVEILLGSSATDLLMCLGPESLRVGSRLYFCQPGD